MRATSVAEIYRTTSPKPLARGEFQAWYVDLGPVRGDGYLRRLQRGLDRAYGEAPFKAFVMGHSGTGKSTELERLAQLVSGRFVTLRMSATLDLNPAAFEPLDVVLVSLEEVVRRAALPVADGGAGFAGDAAALARIRDWMGGTEVVRERAASAEASAEAGVGLDGGSLLATVLGMFASAKAAARYATTRTERRTEHQAARLSELVSIANEILRTSNEALVAASGREWLLVWEDFEKPAIPDRLVEDVFVRSGHLWAELQANLLLTIPMWLGYSEATARLPLAPEQRFVVPDPPVFHPDKSPHAEGRAALLGLLGKRVDLDLFEAGQAEACVVASGGNLRDLLSLVNRAADDALLRDEHAARITAADVDGARTWLRGEYLRRLGESPFEERPLRYDDKVARLREVYGREPGHDVPDAVIHALLRVHAVQEFNHARWLGVHPLVVDILQDQGHFGDRKPAGGTRA